MTRLAWALLALLALLLVPVVPTGRHHRDWRI